MEQKSTRLSTDFLSAERAAQEALLSDFERIEGVPLIRQILDLVPDGVLILNPERQIVFCNRAMLNLLHVDDIKQTLGLRPGEALQCMHSTEFAGGCVTTEFCRECGVSKAILAAGKLGAGESECRILRKDGVALDLRISTGVFELHGNRYIAFTLSDIADENRRKALERIFFHDILNTAGNLRGVTELFKDPDVADKESFMDMAHDLSERLIEEIESQRQLTMAENQELICEPSSFNSKDLMDEIVRAYRIHPVGRSRILRLDHRSAALMIHCDRTILGRVLGNLLKNALEATSVGGTVTLGCKAYEDRLEFWVHNDATMSDPVRRQIFQRSFSTKGSNRGLGTYSVKLLTERYLGGTVGFTTTPGEGTRFFSQIPLGTSPGGNC